MQVLPEHAAHLLHHTCGKATVHAGPYKCYEHDKDLVMPSFYMKDAKPVSPFETPRPISVLIRFTGDMGFHDAIRQRLLTFWRASLAAALGLMLPQLPCMRSDCIYLTSACTASSPCSRLIGILWLQLYPLPVYSLAVSPLPTTLVEMTQASANVALCLACLILSSSALVA